MLYTLEDFHTFIRVSFNGVSMFDIVFSYGLTTEQKKLQTACLIHLVETYNHSAKPS